VTKPTLLKPGAEVLFQNFNLRPDFIPTITYGDNQNAPAIRCVVRCEIHLGTLDGPIVGVGYGSANTWERKHRYRYIDRSCPTCGVEGSIRKSNYPNKNGDFRGEKGWWCKACKANFDNPKEPAILQQQLGQTENSDPHDLENNILKMSKKRAAVDGALMTTASSDLFTQDVEDGTAAADVPSEKKAPARASQEEADEEQPHSEQRSEPEEKKAKKPEKASEPENAKGKSAGVKHPPDGHDDWKNPAALAKECLRLFGGDHTKAQALFEKATGSKTARGMKPSVVLDGWSKLTDLANA